MVDDLIYYTDEYDQEDSKIINVKRLEDDYEEFVGFA